MHNDYDPSDTDAERAVRAAAAKLRGELRGIISEAQHALAMLDQGQAPGRYMTGNGRVLDARDVNAAAASLATLFDNAGLLGLDDEDRVARILHEAGNADATPKAGA